MHEAPPTMLVVKLSNLEKCAHEALPPFFHKDKKNPREFRYLFCKAFRIWTYQKVLDEIQTRDSTIHLNLKFEVYNINLLSMIKVTDDEKVTKFLMRFELPTLQFI